MGLRHSAKRFFGLSPFARKRRRQGDEPGTDPRDLKDELLDEVFIHGLNVSNFVSIGGRSWTDVDWSAHGLRLRSTPANPANAP